MNPKGPKETLYDEKISPLMVQVIQLCIENEIPILVSAQLDGNTGVTTAINRPGWGCSKSLRMAMEMMSPTVAEMHDPEAHAKRQREFRKFFKDTQ